MSHYKYQPSAPEGAKPKETESSLQSATREGVAFSLMTGAGEAYFSAYAIFLKASTAQIAFLAAVPALLGSFAQLLSAWLGHHTGRRKLIMFLGVALQACTWLPMIWLPFFFPQHAVPIFLGSVILYYAAGNLASPVWCSIMGDLVHEDERGRYFGFRSRLMSLANFFALGAAGLVLHLWKLQSQTHIGFLLIFSAAMLARFYATYQVTRIIEPASAPTITPSVSFRESLRGLRHSPFTRFSVFLALMNFSAGIAGPFFSVYMLRDLGFSYLEFMASSAAVVLVQFFTLSVWGRLSDAFGNRLILAVTGFIVPVLPLLWLFSTNFWVILAIQLLGGLSWAGFNLSAGNVVYDTVAPHLRSAYGAVHSILGAVGIFLGTAVGGYLSTRLPTHAEVFGIPIQFTSSLCWVFLISTIARFNTALSFIPLLREARTVRKFSTRAFAHIAGFNRLSSLLRVFGRTP